MTITVFLDGLHQIGYSFALSLPKKVFELHAFDPEGAFLRKLKKEKVIKKAIGQIAHGCKDANVIIINQPVDFLELHYEAIGLNIRPGTVVVDTSPVPLYAGKLAEKFLPPETQYVSLIPAFNLNALKEQSFHQNSAVPEIFKGSTMAVCSPSTKLKDAEQVAAKLAAAVDAIVVFMDPFEAQEAMIKTQMMPKFVAMAVIRALEGHDSWRDEQRLASSDYYQSTNALTGFLELEQPELAALENKESLLRILDEVIAELQDVRDLISSGKKEELREAINDAVQSRISWQHKRGQNSFGIDDSASDLPKNNDVFQQMFLGGFGRKRNSSD
jgi:prephenate dehydrogenase